MSTNTPDRAVVGESSTKFYKDVEPHQFTIDGATYEWVNGVYYKKINEKYEEDSFGQDALLSNAPRNATIKTMEHDVHFAIMSRVNFKNSL